MKFSTKLAILMFLLCVLSVIVCLRVIIVCLRVIVVDRDGTVEPEIITESVELSTPPLPETEEVVETPSYTEKELEILAIIIYQEAGGDACSDDTRMKVGNVFLNRVDSPLFPDTFEEVALQDWQYGTLSQTGLKWPDRASYDAEQHAVERAYDIAKRCLEEDRILPSNVVFQAEFEQGDGTYCYQDGFYFCYVD